MDWVHSTAFGLFASPVVPCIRGFSDSAQVDHRRTAAPHCPLPVVRVGRRPLGPWAALAQPDGKRKASEKRWVCMEGCGACCFLSGSDRGVEDILSGDDLVEYLGMIGDDGWCVHFDKDERKCLMYKRRPRFCRVEAKIFEELYGVQEDEMDEFAKDCCREHIEGIYGKESAEMSRFNRLVG